MKKLLIKGSFLAIIALLPLLLYNIIIDPYSVLRGDYKNMYICPNERYTKTNYILNNPGRYDSFLFGSSRVSQIPSGILSREKGINFYNMTFVSGVPKEYLSIIKLFIKNKISIKNIIIGLDYFSFRALPPPHIRAKEYPFTLLDKVKFFQEYLLLGPDSGILHEMKFDGTDVRYDFTESGCYYFLKREAQLKRNPEKFKKNKKPLPHMCEERLKKSMKELNEIAALCKRNNIHLVFFINPLYANNYLCEDITFMNNVRKQLLTLSDYWDFSGISSVTRTNLNYYDSVHYRPFVGKMILIKIFGIRGTPPADFGIRISSRNITHYLKKQVTEFHNARKEIKPFCPHCQ